MNDSDGYGGGYGDRGDLVVVVTAVGSMVVMSLMMMMIMIGLVMVMVSVEKATATRRIYMFELSEFTC